jgi:hypothetical protein
MTAPAGHLDKVGQAIAAISIGGASGGTVVCLVLTAAHGMARGPDQPFADVALAGAFAGLAVAAGVAFTIGRALGTWRALMVAISAVAGSALVTVLTMPADLAFGRTGLLALAGLCVTIIALATRVFFPRRAAA